jgi:general secretion pathway protein C
MNNPRHGTRSATGATAIGLCGIVATAAALTSAIVWAMHLTAKSTDVPVYAKAVTATGAAPATAQLPATREALSQMFDTSVLTPQGGAPALEGLQLQGIVNDKRGAGVAIFSLDGAAPVRVRAGGQVRDGVRLIEIQAKSVVLERSGQRVELTLAKRMVSPDAYTDNRTRPAAAGAPTVTGNTADGRGVAAPANAPAAR